MMLIFKIVVLCFYFSIVSCKNPTENTILNPPVSIDCNEPKSTQNYTWRIDTIGDFGSHLGGIYAFSDTDAYAMGFLWSNKKNGTAERHWNGKVWSENVYATGLEIGHYSLAATGDEKIMISVGYASVGNPVHALAEFDNRTKKWKKKVFSQPGQFYSVWTDKKGFYAAGGSNGFLVFKNSEGSDWVEQSVPSEAKGTIKYLKGIDFNDLFITVEKVENLDYYRQLWRLQNKKWKKIYDPLQPDSVRYLKTNGRTDFFGFDLSYCPSNNLLTLYAFGNTVEIYHYNSVTNRFIEADVPYREGIGGSAQAINAYSPNDIWFRGVLWHHWDGKTVKYLDFPGYEAFDNSWNATRSPSGKVFIPLGRSEGSFGYTWVIAQGTPNY